MTSSLVAVDREVVEHSFREWQEEQTLLDAQLAESVAALDAYQSHLDSWQQELARERDELREMREALERDRAAGGSNSEQIEVLNRELAASQARRLELEAALAAQRQASEVQHQGEKQATHEHQAFDKAVEQAAAANQGASGTNGSARVEPRRGTSPVLGSVMEQFGKLREQRSMNRSNNKPR